MSDKEIILAVGDTPASLKQLTDLLTAEGYDVRSTISGVQALRFAVSNLPDLILLDIRMPKMDGFEICQRLKAKPETKDVPVIFVSAVTEVAEHLRGFEVGGVDFIIKPYQDEVLLARISSHLTLAKQIKHLKELLKNRTHELMQVENELRESETQLRETQRVAQIGNWELNHLTDVLTCSEEVFRIFEIDREHFGASHEAFLAAVHPQDRDAVHAAYTRSLETREPLDITHGILTTNGRIKYVHENGVTSYSPEGKPLRSIGTVQDITDFKRATSERIRLRNELAHINRVMIISELSASLAHEINQPLGAILNNASAAQIVSSKMKEGNEEVGEILADIIKDASRAAQIIRRIRGVVKNHQTNVESLDLNILIREVMELYRNSLSAEDIFIFLDLQPDLLPIMGDRIRLQQVLMNLIANAMEATRKSSTRKLTIRSTMQSSDMIIVSIIDSGTGIDDAKKDKIFESFFTTKKDGMGMGLRICRSIIEEHGGRIWGENNQGRGATFSFSLNADRGDSG